MPELRYLKDVVTLRLDPDKCNGCGMCMEVCPHVVFSMNGKKAQIADRNACMECGACAVNCPMKAITVEAGVGCAAAVITGYLSGKKSDKKPTCGCDVVTTKESAHDGPESSCCGSRDSSCC